MCNLNFRKHVVPNSWENEKMLVGHKMNEIVWIRCRIHSLTALRLYYVIKRFNSVFAYLKKKNILLLFVRLPNLPI